MGGKERKCCERTTAQKTRSAGMGRSTPSQRDLVSVASGAWTGPGMAKRAFGLSDHLSAQSRLLAQPNTSTARRMLIKLQTSTF